MFDALKEEIALTLLDAQKCIMENNNFKVQLTQLKEENRNLISETSQLKLEIQRLTESLAK